MLVHIDSPLVHTILMAMLISVARYSPGATSNPDGGFGGVTTTGLAHGISELTEGIPPEAN